MPKSDRRPEIGAKERPGRRELDRHNKPPRQACRRREFCHFTDIPSPSLLKHLLNGEGVQQNDALADGVSGRPLRCASPTHGSRPALPRRTTSKRHQPLGERQRERKERQCASRSEPAGGARLAAGVAAAEKDRSMAASGSEGLRINPLRSHCGNPRNTAWQLEPAAARSVLSRLLEGSQPSVKPYPVRWNDTAVRVAAPQPRYTQATDRNSEGCRRGLMAINAPCSAPATRSYLKKDPRSAMSRQESTERSTQNKDSSKIVGLFTPERVGEPNRPSRQHCGTPRKRQRFREKNGTVLARTACLFLRS